jgi:hypothetical protein
MNNLEKMNFIFNEKSNINISKIKETYIKKHYKYLYEDIINYNTNNDLIWTEKIHRYAYCILDNKCYNCDNKTNFRGFTRGYNKFCNSKCMANSQNMQENRMKTLIRNNNEKYGVDNVFQLEHIKDKIKETNIERYGFENANQSDIIKDKIKETNLEKYGVEHYLQTEDKQIKSKKTCIDKYGTEHANQSDIVKDKIKETNIERYGYENPNQSEIVKNKMKETNLKRYGVENIFSYKPILNTFRNRIIEKYNSDINNDSYSLIEYKYEESNFNILHKNCDEIFSINTQQLHNRVLSKNTICTICYPIGDTKSIKETEITNFIKSLNIDSNKDRDILEGKELDIYIPSHNLAIEFNGLYWHSEIHKDKNYHLDKSLQCQEKAIHLIHIWEDEWMFKQDIIKSIILNKLNKIENKIFARKCLVKEVKDSKLVRQFLDTNHIQGYSQSSIKLGLYYNDELVSLMTFGHRHTNRKKEFELIRFCNRLNTNVVGASSKLFKYFLNNYSENNILSYSDFRLFDGKMYETLGFEKIHLSKPDYFWVKGFERKHRFNFNKQQLIKGGYDPNKTEVEIMHERGYFRIWSCGQVRWEYKR